MLKTIFAHLLILFLLVGALSALTIYVGVQVDESRRIETEARIERERLDRERAALEKEMLRRDDLLAHELTLAASRDLQILAEVDRRIAVERANFEQSNRALYHQMAQALQSSAMAEQQAREALQRSQQAQATAMTALYQSQPFYPSQFLPAGCGLSQTYGNPGASPADLARYQEWLAANYLWNMWAANLVPWTDYDRVAQVQRVNRVREKHGLPLRSEAMRHY